MYGAVFEFYHFFHKRRFEKRANLGNKIVKVEDDPLTKFTCRHRVVAVRTTVTTRH